jgi:dolichol-phosphate mannosyltransferase
MKRCLITGASGFVGANVARRLLADGHETHVILRPDHQPWRLREITSGIQAHEGDLTDAEEVRRTVSRIRPEWVFHLAAYGAYPAQTGFARMAEVNLMGSVRLLDACVEFGAESIVFTGSSSEYGYKNHPAHETDLLEPNSHYAITKAAATHYCQFVARQNNIKAIVARLYSIYGPYEEPSRLIPTLIAHGLKGELPSLVSPNTARDFVYVEDAVDALIRLAELPADKSGGIYNICTGVQTSIETVVQVARKLMGITIEPAWATMERRSWDTSTWVGSPEALQWDTGWRATTDFETGLQKTIDWTRYTASVMAR